MNISCRWAPGVYLACTMGITTLSMVLTVYVLNLYGISDRPVPCWAQRLVMVHMARLVRMQKPLRPDTLTPSTAESRWGNLQAYLWLSLSFRSDSQERSFRSLIGCLGLTSGCASFRLHYVVIRIQSESLRVGIRVRFRVRRKD